ncbi:unnamed protein product [Owenia fusiformis]|uniref:Uncharacterized protein n=1 Tax=Owenia fusiformis TaxID=6347 RepID=A0A8J1UU32_OWEFU|nr:unnamed protein product [Owenia fusiformis]
MATNQYIDSTTVSLPFSSHTIILSWLPCHNFFMVTLWSMVVMATFKYYTNEETLSICMSVLCQLNKQPIVSKRRSCLAELLPVFTKRGEYCICYQIYSPFVC